MAKKYSRKKRWFIDTGPYPSYLYYAPSEEAWKSILKKYELPEEPFPTSPGQMTYFSRGYSVGIGIMTINVTKKETEPQVVAMIAHEAVHYLDYMCERIGEHNPGMEFKAYTVQTIVQGVYTVWKGLK